LGIGVTFTRKNFKKSAIFGNFATDYARITAFQRAHGHLSFESGTGTGAINSFLSS
jgi:hypothetical protein